VVDTQANTKNKVRKYSIITLNVYALISWYQKHLVTYFDVRSRNKKNDEIHM
jgi:hypothetical protein